MKQLKWLLLLLPQFAIGQMQSGIKFEDKLKWEQIKVKAAAENKYIFVDVNATWCAPCKMMDREVFSDSSVGNLFNKEFISLKLQIDTTKADNDYTKSLYYLASKFTKEYNISSLPTYLFFSPNGQIIHKSIGLRTSDEFIKMTNEMLNNEEGQFYTQLRRYRNGEKSNKTVSHLLKMSADLREQLLMSEIAEDYINNFLLKLDKKRLFTKENLQILSSYIKSSSDKSFKLFLENGDEIDSIMGQHYARKLVDLVIKREDVNPYFTSLSQNISPNWDKLFKKIERKYDINCAERNVLDAKIVWYYKTGKDWNAFAVNAVQQVERYGIDTSTFIGRTKLNNYSWKIFQHSNNASYINKAVVWMTSVITYSLSKREETFMNLDTYANLLYKSGRKEEAILWEQLALRGAVKANSVRSMKEYENTIAKMKDNEPTW